MIMKSGRVPAAAVAELWRGRWQACEEGAGRERDTRTEGHVELEANAAVRGGGGGVDLCSAATCLLLLLGGHGGGARLLRRRRGALCSGQLPGGLPEIRGQTRSTSSEAWSSVIEL